MVGELLGHRFIGVLGASFLVDWWVLFMMNGAGEAHPANSNGLAHRMVCYRNGQFFQGWSR